MEIKSTEKESLSKYSERADLLMDIAHEHAASGDHFLCYNNCVSSAMNWGKHHLEMKNCDEKLIASMHNLKDIYVELCKLAEVAVVQADLDALSEFIDKDSRFAANSSKALSRVSYIKAILATVYLRRWYNEIIKKLEGTKSAVERNESETGIPVLEEECSVEVLIQNVKEIVTDLEKDIQGRDLNVNFMINSTKLGYKMLSLMAQLDSSETSVETMDEVIEVCQRILNMTKARVLGVMNGILRSVSEYCEALMRSKKPKLSAEGARELDEYLSSIVHTKPSTKGINKIDVFGKIDDKINTVPINLSIRQD